MDGCFSTAIQEKKTGKEKKARIIYISDDKSSFL